MIKKAVKFSLLVVLLIFILAISINIFTIYQINPAIKLKGAMKNDLQLNASVLFLFQH
ncbi:hypothetical protein SAMN05660649_04496 [Desulfotomaculum arcticum]|uniref:Uncharacterized protein n=1 Tax=Desulfotruncus arcticus DSM 17038 TaxID=1121424 RepID=A0A1I2YMJ4_9FIRM|nr:hypothetical protein [Desulfotruncus arcticus]SFH26894.1 hypothetical protein SAMN05660649_04496 [Desulfotomaculum arcticum] [Desulfotruncus arcticus DSM 17038]